MARVMVWGPVGGSVWRQRLAADYEWEASCTLGGLGQQGRGVVIIIKSDVC